MSADTKIMAHLRMRNLPGALRALFAWVAVVAAFAYAINAWQVFGFAQHVWRLPIVLCVGAAGVADALSLCGLFATYALRTARWRVRAYAWFVFGLMTGLSMLAAHSFALWRQLPEREQGTAGHADAQLASVAIVGALALAVHMLIVCVRHAEPAATVEPPPALTVSSGEMAAMPGQDLVAAAVAAALPARVALPSVNRGHRPTLTLVAKDPQPRRPRPAAPPTDERKATAVKRVIDGGESARSVAIDIGEPPRNVQNWVKAEEKRRDDASRLLLLLSSSPLHPPTTGENTLPPPTLGVDDNDDNNDRRVQ